MAAHSLGLVQRSSFGKEGGCLRLAPSPLICSLHKDHQLLSLPDATIQIELVTHLYNLLYRSVGVRMKNPYCGSSWFRAGLVLAARGLLALGSPSLPLTSSTLSTGIINSFLCQMQPSKWLEGFCLFNSWWLQ